HATARLSPNKNAGAKPARRTHGARTFAFARHAGLMRRSQRRRANCMYTFGEHTRFKRDALTLKACVCQNGCVCKARAFMRRPARAQARRRGHRLKIFLWANRSLFTLSQSNDCLKRAGMRLIATLEARSSGRQPASAIMTSLQ